MLKLTTFVALMKGMAVIFIKETQGESKASAVQFITRDKKGRAKYRVVLFSRALQEMFDQADRDPKWLAENRDDLRINFYDKVDEEVGTSYRVWQLTHKDQESKATAAEDLFAVSSDEVEGLVNTSKDELTLQDIFDMLVNSFEYDTRAEVATEKKDIEAAINNATPVGATEE